MFLIIYFMLHYLIGPNVYSVKAEHLSSFLRRQVDMWLKMEVFAVRVDGELRWHRNEIRRVSYVHVLKRACMHMK